jgi:hypothetical protein
MPIVFGFGWFRAGVGCFGRPLANQRHLALLLLLLLLNLITDCSGLQ